MNRCWLVLGLVVIGCGPQAAPPAVSPPETASLGLAFDPVQSGNVTGNVHWKGEPPAILLTSAPDNPATAPVHGPVTPRPNPHAPRIDASTSGLADAVLSLQPVALGRARPWDWPEVRVEIGHGELNVVQGNQRGRTGIVRRGQSVEMVSREAHLHLLRGRGAAFFSQPLNKPEVPRRRTFTETGIVELSSGCGFYWMRGYLFVTDHPYHAISDAQGSYTLPQVPSGEYDLIAWLPNWRERDWQIHPDSGYRITLNYQEPLRIARRVIVTPGQTTLVPPFVFDAACPDR